MILRLRRSPYLWSRTTFEILLPLGEREATRKPRRLSLFTLETTSRCSICGWLLVRTVYELTPYNYCHFEPLRRLVFAALGCRLYRVHLWRKSWRSGDALVSTQRTTGLALVVMNCRSLKRESHDKISMATTKLHKRDHPTYCRQIESFCSEVRRVPRERERERGREY